ALRISAAAQKRPARSALHGHWAAALFALNAGFDRLERIALGIYVLGVTALRIAGAGQKRTARSLAEHHRFAAFVADMLCRLAGQHGLTFGVEVHCRLAFWIAAAPQERSAFPHPLQHGLSALGTLVLGFFGRLAHAFLVAFLLDVFAFRMIGA